MFVVGDDNCRGGHAIVFKLEMKVLYLNERFQIRTLGREFSYSKKAIEGHQKHGLEQQPLICGWVGMI